MLLPISHQKFINMHKPIRLWSTRLIKRCIPLILLIYFCFLMFSSSFILVSGKRCRIYLLTDSDKQVDDKTDFLEKLERLTNLKQKNILTEKEFQALKSQIIEKLSGGIENTDQEQLIESNEVTIASNSKIYPQIQKQNASQFLEYKNSKYGIKIQYPPSWEGTELDYDYGDGLIRIVEFGVPPKKPLKIYSKNRQHRHLLSISVKDVHVQIPLSILTRKQIFELKRLKNMKVIESAETTLSARPGHKIIFTYFSSGITLKSMRLWTVCAGRVFYVSYTAFEKEFFMELESIEKMINSFLLVNTPAIGTGEDPLDEYNFLVYHNKNLGAKVEYPREWTFHELNSTKQSFQVEFWSPEGPNSENYEGLLVVEKKSMQSTLVLEQYVHDYIYKLMIKSRESFKLVLLESTTAAVDNLPA
jgi:hypothetical protein